MGWQDAPIVKRAKEQSIDQWTGKADAWKQAPVAEQQEMPSLYAGAGSGEAYSQPVSLPPRQASVIDKLLQASGKFGQGIKEQPVETLIGLAQGVSGTRYPHEVSQQFEEKMPSVNLPPDAKPAPEISEQQQMARGVGDFGAKTAGGIWASSFVPGAGFLPTMAKGAVANVPHLGKYVEEGDLKGAAGDMALNTLIDMVLYGGGKAYRAFKGPSVAQLDEAVKKGVSKGVKPIQGLKRDPKILNKKLAKGNKAVKTIAYRKGQLNLVDDVGTPITRPRTNQQFHDAIKQTEGLVYDDISRMLREVGDSGPGLNVKSIKSKLAKRLSDKGNLPEIQAHMEKRIAELEPLANASPAEINTRIQQLNAGLGSYYDNPSNKLKGNVDAHIAVEIRKQLDDIIKSMGGEGFQELKNQYGALREIERDVAYRALKQATQSPKGLFDVIDPLSNGELGMAIFTMNPALGAKAMTQKGSVKLMKFLNNPDRAIDKMFKVAYKASDDALGIVPPKMPELPAPDYETPTFARQGLSPDDLIRKEQAAQDATAQAIQAERAASQQAQEAGQREILEAIMKLRPQVTPQQDAITSMRQWQTGRTR